MMLLTITALPAIEEELIDWLLMQTDITGFTSQATNGYGHGHKMSVVEQVTGRRRQISFAIELKNEFADIIIAELKNSFKGNGLHYRLIPISQSGQL